MFTTTRSCWCSSPSHEAGSADRVVLHRPPLGPCCHPGCSVSCLTCREPDGSIGRPFYAPLTRACLAMLVSLVHARRPFVGAVAFIAALGCGGSSTGPDAPNGPGSGSSSPTHPAGAIASTLSISG